MQNFTRGTNLAARGGKGTPWHERCYARAVVQAGLPDRWQDFGCDPFPEAMRRSARRRGFSATKLGVGGGCHKYDVL